MSRKTAAYEDVFDALDRPDALSMRTRVGLAAILTDHIRSNGWTQQAAAGHLEVTQGDVSRLMNGNVRGFSEARLEKLLVRMDLVVRIIVSHPVDGETPGVMVEAA